MDKQTININRELFDTPNEDRSRFRSSGGLTEELVREIFTQKNEPAWMLEKRLAALKHWNDAPFPDWGPSLKNLSIDDVALYVRPDAAESTSWDDVPDDIKQTFDKLGIPEAERKHLAGVGAQYDSDMVYHNLKKDLQSKGVIFENMDVALREHEELVREYFMTSCIPIHDHKFIMLHAAVWSGGTFIYVPKGVKVELPLQAYFRMNAPGAGQFEHTLIIADEDSEIQYIEGCSAPRYDVNALHAGCVEIFAKKGARVRYFSVENWSKNTYNLNTKRALVDENATMEWVSGNMGSGTTMLYPSSILRGERAVSDNLSIVFSGEDQNQDVGAKAIHVAPNTSSTIRSKSIVVGNGISTYRGLAKVTGNAENARIAVNCDTLLLGDKARSQTIPAMSSANDSTQMAHEATAGNIGEEEIHFLNSRGLDEQEATKLIVSGFIEPITKKLPLEYAVELNRLVELEMEGAIG